MSLLSDIKLILSGKRISGENVIDKFGENSDIDTTSVPETVFSLGGTFPFLDAGIDVDIVSTSANDNISGTGARTAKVTWYDTNYIKHNTTVSLAGTTQVELGSTFLMCSRIEVMSSGTAGNNEGIIKIVDRTTGLTVYQQIEIGEGQTLSAVQMIEKGCSGKIKSHYCTYARVSNRNAAQLRLRVRKPDGTICTKYNVSISTDNPKDEVGYKYGGISVSAGEIVFWEVVTVSANDTPIEAGFTIVC